SHVWSERYERPLDDIFDVQNEVTQKIAAAVGGAWGTISAADTAAARRKPPASLQAYDYYVLALDLIRVQTKENFDKAEDLLKKAIELDPQLARAYAAMGNLYEVRAYQRWGPDEGAAQLQRARALLLTAVALDPTDAVIHRRLGGVYCETNDC